MRGDAREARKSCIPDDASPGDCLCEVYHKSLYKAIDDKIQVLFINKKIIGRNEIFHRKEVLTFFIPGEGQHEQVKALPPQPGSKGFLVNLCR